MHTARQRRKDGHNTNRLDRAERTEARMARAKAKRGERTGKSKRLDRGVSSRLNFSLKSFFIHIYINNAAEAKGLTSLRGSCLQRLKFNLFKLEQS